MCHCREILTCATGRDSATFRDKGTEVPSLSRDKGTMGQAKNLTKGQDGQGQQDVLKQENDVPKQDIW